MNDKVRFFADVTRIGRFVWRWEVVQKHYFIHGSSFAVLDSGVTWTQAGARRASNRAVRRHKAKQKWDIFSEVHEVA